MGYIEINKTHFFHNLDVIAEEAGGKDKIALVLKDNAYGHGLDIMAQLAHEYGITKTVVRTLNEAAQIHDYFEHILVLADTPETAPSSKISVVVNSMTMLQQLPEGTGIELKIDTGMHRNGIEPEMLTLALVRIKERALRLNGVMTHYRSADELSSELFWQRRQFEQIKIEVKKLHDAPVRFHSHNSAALFRNSNFSEDLVRVGIAAYGCLELPRPYTQPNLKPVLSLWAEKIATRTLHEGERIGYSGVFEATESKTVSTYDIGYADGFSRVDGYTTPEGYTLLGRVSMDNISLDSNETRVQLFDNVNRFAKARNTIGYEVLTSMSPTLERRVIT